MCSRATRTCRPRRPWSCKSPGLTRPAWVLMKPDARRARPALMSELTLYVDSNYDSPWAMSAFVALEEKRLQYELVAKVLSKKETFEAGYGGGANQGPAPTRTPLR